jgi:hypothetical protein
VTGITKDFCSINSGHFPSHLMIIRVDSIEYKSWHEVGHATICLNLGGDVAFIEFLDGDVRGHARNRCLDKWDCLADRFDLMGFFGPIST